MKMKQRRVRGNRSLYTVELYSRDGKSAELYTSCGWVWYFGKTCITSLRMPYVHRCTKKAAKKFNWNINY